MNFHQGLIFFAAASALIAQPVSSYRYTAKGDERIVEITNVNYELVPADLVLRTTTNIKQNLGDIGVEALTTVEAWKLGVDLKTKPLYTVKSPGTDSRTVDGEVFAISAGVEEVEWWSVYSVATGAHLFDTYVPLASVNIDRASLTMRYIGLEVPEDDTKDARLKDPHVVAVVSYASSEKVIREALITCDDSKQAAQLRSFADESRTMNAGTELAPAVHLSFSQNYPSPPATVSLTIPIAKDDLDLAHAQLPAKMHVAAWRR
ncbi:MAG TPA: hypothetical protein VMT15_11315 [Bryobacteraceae bacterium]|nr:hypothetical protein [Bryobacteraceae bacterium]